MRLVVATIPLNMYASLQVNNTTKLFIKMHAISLRKSNVNIPNRECLAITKVNMSM